MLRAVLSALVLALTAVPVATEVNCHRPYVEFLQGINFEDATAGDRLANLHRRALRILDACDSGHLDNPEPMFRQLQKS